MKRMEKKNLYRDDPTRFPFSGIQYLNDTTFHSHQNHNIGDLVHMGIVDTMTNWLTGKDLKTVVRPVLNTTNQITLTTTKKFNNHAYILNINQIKNEDNTYIAKLPKKSNIKDIEKVLNTINKRYKGIKIVESEDEHIKMSWIDRFNRYFATKIEQPMGVSYTIRNDTVNQMFNEGIVLAQCNTAECLILFPRKTCTDFLAFAAKDPKL